MTTQDSRTGAERANTFPWPPVLFVAAVAAALGFGRVFPVSWPGVDDSAARFIGIAIGVTGVALVAWAVRTLMKAGTTVLPDRTSDVLVTSGPYWRFRNPMYLGNAMILLGLAEITKNVWFVAGAASFVVLVTWLQILPEERHLTHRFGAAYDAYKTRSRRWI